jgi:hypothetical protein
MTAREWIDAYAAALGAPAPDEARVGAILRLASEAAHASERIAAPVACWLAAEAGLDPEAALARARSLGT